MRLWFWGEVPGESGGEWGFQAANPQLRAIGKLAPLAPLSLLGVSNASDMSVSVSRGFLACPQFPNAQVPSHQEPVFDSGKVTNAALIKDSGSTISSRPLVWSVERV